MFHVTSHRRHFAILGSAFAGVCAFALACDSDDASSTPQPSVLEAHSSTAIQAAVGTVVSPRPSVRVTDDRGRPVADVTVTFAITEGEGALTGANVRTDADGVAAVGSWTLGTIAGQQTLTARRPGLPSVVFRATAVAGDAARLVLTTAPSATSPSRAVLARQPVVRLHDTYGNVVVASGARVTASVGSSAVLSGTVAVETDADGIATFRDLSIAGGVGANVVTFESPGLDAITAPVTLTAGEAALAFAMVGDQLVAPGSPVLSVPSVRVTDADGNPVPGLAVTFAAAAGDGVSGSTRTTDEAGVAAVGGWTVGASVGTHVLTATAVGLGALPVSFRAIVPQPVNVTNAFSPNAATISTSEGAPYGEKDFWLQKSMEVNTDYGYGPTKVVRLYICLSGTVAVSECSNRPSPTGPLPASLLNSLDLEIGRFAGKGARLLLRFVYNFGPIGPEARDVPASLIATHIDQLAPVLLKHKDLIFALQAGFIGTWGEWHHSTSGNENSAAKRIVLDRERAHFAGVFPILLRYPADLLDYIAGAPAGTDLGIHDDFYASSEDHGGTWVSPDYPPSHLQNLATVVSTTSMFIGEFSGPPLYPPLQNCPALDALSYRYHLQSISLNIYPKEIGAYLTSQGCATWFFDKVGVRMVLESATLQGDAFPGGVLRTSLRLVNAGYGRVIRPRPASLVLLSGEQPIAVIPIPVSDLDVRTLMSSATPQPRTFTFDVRLPATLPVSPLRVALYFADPAPSLSSLPAYALPLNSVDGLSRAVFDAVTGYNVIGTINADIAQSARAAPARR